MFIEPCAPGTADAVTRLQHRPQPRARPSSHQTEMAAVGTRHQFEDGIGLPVTPRAEHDALVSPFHRQSLQYPSGRMILSEMTANFRDHDFARRMILPEKSHSFSGSCSYLVA
jgi:hypothetical protein